KDLASSVTLSGTVSSKRPVPRRGMIRPYWRGLSAGKECDESKLERGGLKAQQTKEMYRLLAIAKYEDLFVIPTSRKQTHMNMYRSQGSAGYDELGTMNTGAEQTQNPDQYNYSMYDENGNCSG